MALDPLAVRQLTVNGERHRNFGRAASCAIF
jgi:hypothetical protein